MCPWALLTRVNVLTNGQSKRKSALKVLNRDQAIESKFGFGRCENNQRVVLSHPGKWTGGTNPRQEVLTVAAKAASQLITLPDCGCRCVRRDGADQSGPCKFVRWPAYSSKATSAKPPLVGKKCESYDEFRLNVTR